MAMKKWFASVAVGLCTWGLSVGVQAAMVQYDAGLSPSVATSPATQGWSELGVNSGNGATASAVNDDLGSGLNAWNITDGSTSDRPRYEAALDSGDIIAMADNGWVLTVQARGVGSSGNIVWGVSDDSVFGGSGVARRWGTGFNISGGNLYVQWYGGGQQQVTTDGSGAAAYHEVMLVGQAGSLDASLYIDGNLIGSNSGQQNSGTQNKIEFGATSTGGTGSQVNWHSIDLSVAPEPASLGLLGLAGLWLIGRWRP